MLRLQNGAVLRIAFSWYCLLDESPFLGGSSGLNNNHHQIVPPKVHSICDLAHISI
jgi:hypothetical protein